MERHIDYLSFQAGGKMTVPFEAFLIFSTNLRPDQLGDEAFLRRIQYKMFLRSPQGAGVRRRSSSASPNRAHAGLHARRWLKRSSRSTTSQGGKRFRRCHPRDVISHAIDIINFEALPMELTEDVLDRAFDSCFVENVDVND